MKKYLLPETGTFYKANLHCHTTVSDGSLTPEQVKAIYKEAGYSIVAFTDHDVMIPHPELAEEDFLPLTSFEIQLNGNREDYLFSGKTCHLCLIALEPDQKKMVCYNRKEYLKPHQEPLRSVIEFDESQPDFVRDYTPECINEVIRQGRENGFFVTYNHPTWSRENYPEYSTYEGMNAMEIVNYSCVVSGFDDHNGRVYDDLLHQGKKLYVLATDDNHDRHPQGTAHFDSLGGFVMIKAEKLEYRTITKALEDGHFYASEGPAIKELTYENGVVHIETSPAFAIDYIGGRRVGKRESVLNGTVTSADFEVKMEDGYFRLDVIDPAGKHAYTNAFFVEDLK